MDPGTGTAAGLSISSRSEPERAYVIAALSGELDIACAPALREQLLGLLRAASRCHRPVRGQLRRRQRPRRTGRHRTPRRVTRRVLAPGRTGARGSQGPAHHRPAPAVRYLPHSPGRDHQPGGGQRRPYGKADANTGTAASPVHTQPAPGLGERTGRTRHPADAGELRQAIAAVLMHADAWRDADPRRRFTAALSALARAHAGTSHAALTQAADSLLSILTRQPLTHSPSGRRDRQPSSPHPRPRSVARPPLTALATPCCAAPGSPMI